MRVTLICCPFQTSYGSYADSLRKAIERKTCKPVQWVGSNCGCGDPIEVGRLFQTRGCDYFEFPHVGNYESTTAWKRWARVQVRDLGYSIRARRYRRLSATAELVHFQQTLNAYGFSVVFHWLNRPSAAARVITVHEIDPLQNRFPERNTVYNKADAVIVHFDGLKRELVKLGVQPEKIHVVLHGTEIPEFNDENMRDGIVFYGGHKLMTGKGIQTLFAAMSIVKERLGDQVPLLKIHGHYGETTPEEAQRLAQRHGIAENIQWLNQLSIEEIVALYRNSLLLTLPFTGSFAGLPASIAAANRLPIVCTKKAGLPDHLGECGIWVEQENPQELADRILKLLSNPELRQAVARKLRKRAEQYLSWEVIANQTLEVYSSAIAQRVPERPGNISAPKPAQELIASQLPILK